MRAVRILRTVAFSLGLVFVGLLVLALLSALASVIVGTNAHEAGDSNTAGLAKLACIISLSAAGALVGPSLLCLLFGVVLHVVLRRGHAPDTRQPPDS